MATPRANSKSTKLQLGGWVPEENPISILTNSINSLKSISPLTSSSISENKKSLVQIVAAGAGAGLSVHKLHMSLWFEQTQQTPLEWRNVCRQFSWRRLRTGVWLAGGHTTSKLPVRLSRRLNTDCGIPRIVSFAPSTTPPLVTSEAV